ISISGISISGISISGISISGISISGISISGISISGISGLSRCRFGRCVLGGSWFGIGTFAGASREPVDPTTDNQDRNQNIWQHCRSHLFDHFPGISRLAVLIDRGVALLFEFRPVFRTAAALGNDGANGQRKQKYPSQQTQSETGHRSHWSLLKHLFTELDHHLVTGVLFFTSLFRLTMGQ
ncbi:MAG: hypothetical protein VB859_16380, partial [Planctomycetaceae bacterium]